MSTMSFTAAVSALLLIATVLVAGQQPLTEIEITDTYVQPGQDVTIGCRVEHKGENNVVLKKTLTGNTMAVVFVNNQLMPEQQASKRYTLDILPLGENKKMYKLSIKNTTVEDSGPYRCNIETIDVAADKEFFVYNPVQQLLLNNISLDHEYSVEKMNESAAMDLDCTAKGSIPAATIKMFMGDREITNEHTKMFTSAEVQCEGEESKCIKHETFTKSAMIQDFRVSYKDHNKKLKCVATVDNTNFKREAGYTILVEYAPKFVCDMNQVARLADSNYKLKCKVLSNPGNPDFVWEFTWGGETQQLRNNDQTTDGEIRAGQVPSSDGDGMDVFLTIKKVSARHFMDFLLKSNNSIGRNQTSIRLAQDDTANAAGINSISTIFVLFLVLLRAHL